MCEHPYVNINVWTSMIICWRDAASWIWEVGNLFVLTQWVNFVLRLILWLLGLKFLDLGLSSMVVMRELQTAINQILEYAHAISLYLVTDNLNTVFFFLLTLLAKSIIWKPADPFKHCKNCIFYVVQRCYVLDFLGCSRGIWNLHSLFIKWRCFRLIQGLFLKLWCGSCLSFWYCSML